MNVVITGSKGLAGSALCKTFSESGYNVIPLHREIVDLSNELETSDVISEIKPTLIINASAKVGGIQFNSDFPVEILLENLKIQNSLLNAAHANKVEGFIFLGSSCVYPKFAPQPLKEEYLLSGNLESTNSAYALAKITGIELVKAYRKQYGYKWFSVMPSNLYGPGDNFNLRNAHVMPAMIRKFVEASESGISHVTLWGTGSPLREFMHVDDMARAVVFSYQKYSSSLQLNIGTGIEISIKDLAQMIAELTEFKGEVNWDHSKPDGVQRKVLDVSRITTLGWSPSISMREGIIDTISWFRKNRSKGAMRL
jgi:GDP-L-fucose synthase